MRTSRAIAAGILLLIPLCVCLPARAAEQAAPPLLFDFGPAFKLDSVQTTDANTSLTETGALSITTGHEAPWPGITLKAPRGKWDLSAYQTLAL
ncbi:MAG: hypothetical protein ACYTAS_17335, partial [Planctomycetota bacterium]